MLKLERVARFDRAGKDEGGDYVIGMAFASEEPYERWFGIEILDCRAESVRLDRLNDGAPVLFNHGWSDIRGVHEPGTIRCDADQVVRGDVRLTSATQAGRETIELVKSRVLTKASVGYIIHRVVEISKKKDGSEQRIEHDGRLFSRVLERCAKDDVGDRGEFLRRLDQARGEHTERAADEPPVFRVMDWEPYENSLVTVPADPTVGVGRLAERVDSIADATASVSETVVHKPAHNAARSINVNDDKTAAAGASAETERQDRERGAGQRGRAEELEGQRVRAIDNLCKGNKIDKAVRDHWVGSGLGLDEVSEDLLKILEKRSEVNPKPATMLGLSEKEVQRFSLFRAIKAAADQNWTQAGFELDCSREIAKRLDKLADPKTFFVPFDVMQRSVPVRARRDATVASAGGGGYLVATENVSFIELLRNRSVAYRMGARRLSGLVGNVTIPRQSAGATAVWLANEGSTITESAQTYQQVSLTPKTVGAYTEVSRQLMLQSSPDAEGIVTADLAAVTATAVDVGVLRGAGSGGEPQGIVGTSGLGAVTGTSLAYAGILEFQTDVAAANVMPSAGGYVTTPAVAALLKQRARFSNTDTPLWQGNIWDGTIEGFPAMSSNQMSSATMLFGDWSQVIVGEWGVLQVDVNPFANFQAGIIGVRAIVTMDAALRYPAAFSYASSIT